MLLASRLTLPGILQGVSTLAVLGVFMLQGFMIRKLYRYKQLCILVIKFSLFFLIKFSLVVHTTYSCLSFVQIKTLPFEHDCPTTKLVVNKMPSQEWVSDRLKEWLKKNPSKRPKAAKEKVEG